MVKTLIEVLYRTYVELALLIPFGVASSRDCVHSEKKRDTRAATGWLVLSGFRPILVFSLCLFGINRINRRGQLISRQKNLDTSSAAQESNKDLEAKLEFISPKLRKLSQKTSGRALSYAETIEILAGGDCAYSAMLESIDLAKQSVLLQSYIFDRGHIGDRFIECLARAVSRGESQSPR